MVVNPKASHTFQLNGAFPYLLTWLTLLCFLFCFDLFLCCMQMTVKPYETQLFLVFVFQRTFERRFLDLLYARGKMPETTYINVYLK